MRDNQPVTGVETLLPEGQFVYSRTDLQGNIIEANEAFANISDYPREEMLGQSHNIVRHPDMPPQAFQDMWQDLKAGRPWRGLVKNRRRDGGYYWVVANASPVREQGQVVGYQSVRSRPCRDEVEVVATVYQRIRSGDTSIRIEHGRVVPARRPLFTVFSGLGIQSLLVGLMALVLSGAVLAGSILPMALMLPVLQVLATLSTMLTIYFLLYSLPRLRSDLSATSDYLEHLLVSGDLKKRFDLSRKDQLGEIAHKIDRFVSSIQATVQGIDDTASQVQQVANEVHQGILKVNEAAHIQSEATSSAAAGIEQITVSNGEVTTHAESTRASAFLTAELSAQGSELSEQACSSILSLADTVKTSAIMVGRLGEQSEEISRITGVITDIANQTNLLALNAAIEAARAGEAGRGFVVVADEVHKLAERTGKATREISDMIQSVQEEISKAVSGMRSGAVQVENGVVLVQKTQNALQEINTQMANNMAMVSDIFHSSQEQHQALSQMAPNVERIASMTEQNLTVVNHTNATVNRLNDMVVRLQKCVAQYSI